MVELQLYAGQEEEAISLIQGFWLAHNNYIQPEDESRENLTAWTNQGHIFYFILFEEKKVGFLHLGSRGNQPDWLEDVFVLPAYQRRGIGSQAIRLVEEIVKTYSVSLYLEAAARNEAAIRLYRRLGFDCLNTVTLRKDFPGYDYEVTGTEQVFGLSFDIRRGK